MVKLNREVWRELDSLLQEIEGLLESRALAPASVVSPVGLFPPVDVFEDGDAVVVEAEVPGVTADRLRVELHGDRLVIAGELGFQSQEGGAELLRMERPRGRFVRAIPLPSPVAPPFEATLSRGVLVVRLPKTKALGKSIPIAREGA